MLVDGWNSSQHSHREGNDDGPAQHGQQGAARCEEADANAAVALWAVEFIQSYDMVQQVCGLPSQKPAECCCQEQA